MKSLRDCKILSIILFYTFIQKQCGFAQKLAILAAWLQKLIANLETWKIAFWQCLETLALSFYVWAFCKYSSIIILMIFGKDKSFKKGLIKEGSDIW